MKLKLKKEIITNKELSHNAIMAYLGIICCWNSSFDYIFANRNMINYFLSNKIIFSRRFDENVKNGIQELLDKKIIVCSEKIGVDYCLQSDNIRLKEDDKFIFVDIEDVHKILNCSHQNKVGLLRFYICLLSTFLSKNTVQDIRQPDKFNNVMGMMSQEYLANLTGLSSHSIVEYIKTLEKLELIYVYRCAFMFKDINGRIKKHNNIYGRYQDKAIIDEFAEIKYNMYDDLHQVQADKVANSYRSLMQKYNCLCNGKQYDDKTIENIFKHVVNFNNKHPRHEKDLTIFKKYGFSID